MPRQLAILRMPLSCHYDVESRAGEPLFYADVSLLTPGKPDLTLHRGPVVAVCRLARLSSAAAVGLGDPARPAAVR